MLRDPMAWSGLSCRNCGRMWPSPSDAEFDRYFQGGEWTCLDCGQSVKLWSMLRAALRETHPFIPGALALGMASASHATLSLSADAVDLDLAHMGVPADAKVLGVNFTPQAVEGKSIYFPATSRQSYTSGDLDHVFYVFGRRLGTEPDVADPTEVSVFCHWLNPNADPELEPLASAVEAFTDEAYRQVIVPACVAVEDMLATVLVRHFETFGQKDAGDFVKSVSLAYKLKYLLPSVMLAKGAPDLSAEVRQQLMTLRSIRNDVAHRHRQVARTDAADMLLGAVFGVRYMRLYGTQPQASPTQSSSGASCPVAGDA